MNRLDYSPIYEDFKLFRANNALTLANVDRIMKNEVTRLERKDMRTSQAEALQMHGITANRSRQQPPLAEPEAAAATVKSALTM